ncbi:MAG: deoxyribose-phosphate aldolase [Clostridia bacterium]|nr:deoxyribose-phosphate aldolase [Clostridia bacterium]
MTTLQQRVQALNLTPSVLAQLFDQTLLKPDVNDARLEAFCRVAAQFGFRNVAVNTAQVAKCKTWLKGSGVGVDAAVGFSLGQTKIQTKVFETRQALEDGADEIDYLLNITEIKNGNYRYVEDEMRQIVGLCRAHAKVSKVILETCYLTDDEKRAVCEIAAKVGITFVKTSTGFGPGGATAADIRLMKQAVGDSGVKVKAAGGIRTVSTVVDMLEAGAERIGTSGGVAMLQELEEILAGKLPNGVQASDGGAY